MGEDLEISEWSIVFGIKDVVSKFGETGNRIDIFWTS